MLRIVKKFRELPFGHLMEVYREGNEENGRDRWPQEPPARQLALAEEDFYQYLCQVFFPTPGARYALWEVAGRLVSVLRLEPYRDGLLISALETLPQMRCRGYARALLGAVCREYGQVRLYSHVGKRNGASLKVHEKSGFRRKLEYAVYLDGSVNSRCCTLVWEPGVAIFPEI